MCIRDSAYAAFATLKFFELENVFGVNALILAYLFVVLILMPFVFKRLRYFGQSGWLVLFLLVPVLNILLILYLLFKSDNQVNDKHSPTPTESKFSGRINAKSFITPTLYLIIIPYILYIPFYFTDLGEYFLGVIFLLGFHEVMYIVLFFIIFGLYIILPAIIIASPVFLIHLALSLIHI